MNTSNHPLMEAIHSGQAFTAKQWIKNLSLDEGHVFLDALDVALDERQKWGHDRCVRMMLNNLPSDERLRSIVMARMNTPDRVEYLKLMAREGLVDHNGMTVAVMAVAEAGYWEGLRVLEQFGAPMKNVDYVRSAMWSKDPSMAKWFAGADFDQYQRWDIVRYAAERDTWSKEMVEAVYDFEASVCVFGTIEKHINDHIQNPHFAAKHIRQLTECGRLNEGARPAPPLN